MVLLSQEDVRVGLLSVILLLYEEIMRIIKQGKVELVDGDNQSFYYIVWVFGFCYV